MIKNIAPHIMTPQRFFQGLSESSLLLRFKWRSVRSVTSKGIIWAGLIVYIVAFVAVSNTGYFLRSLAKGIAGVDSVIQDVATDYLLTFSQGGLGVIGATALGAALISSVIAPFTGSVSTSLLPPTSMVSLGSTSHHRFTDSILAQLISSVALLQVLSLTTVASLLTLSGGRSWGIILALALCPILTMISVCALWGSELLHRRIGGRVKTIVVGVILAIVGLAILIDPQHGKTVFGLGSVFASTVQNMSTYSSLHQIAIFLAIALVVIILIFISGTMASYTLSIPEKTSQQKKVKKRIRKVSIYPEIETFYIMLSQVWRNPETRKPIMVAVIVGMTVAFFTSANFAVQTTFTVMVPVIVALAWGVNSFGIIGSGMTWLSSQPRIIMFLPWVIATVQMSVTFAMFCIIWLPSFVTGKATLEEMLSIILAAISVTILITRSSLHKSVNSPYPTNPGNRGEGIVPPVITLAYTLRMALWAGQYGVIILVLNNPLMEIGLCVLAILWSSWRFSRIGHKWTDPYTREKVTLIVSR